jgi:DNA replication and repair protein RecF
LFLKEIRINGFRNLSSQIYEAQKGLNILIGENGQGKTNFLEAVYYLSCGSSFRASDHKVLVNYDEKHFTIEAVNNIKDKWLKAAVIYERNKGKKFSLNDKRSAYSENFMNAVLFTPDDLYLIKGSPKQRRDYLDYGLKQIAKEYYGYFENYGKILKKRNFLLKSEQTKGGLYKTLNDVFIEQAARIILARFNYINLLDDVLKETYKSLNGGGNQLKIKYALSFPLDHDKINLTILSEKIKEQIDLKAGQEIKRKSVLVGPHLDDLHIYFDNRPARQYCSQGQQRSIAVSLKLAELCAFAKIKGYYPLFLLDEVMAELDENKRCLLLNYLEKAPFQSFMTAVNSEYLGELKNTLLTVIDNGVLKKKGAV